MADILASGFRRPVPAVGVVESVSIMTAENSFVSQKVSMTFSDWLLHMPLTLRYRIYRRLDRP